MTARYPTALLFFFLVVGVVPWAEAAASCTLDTWCWLPDWRSEYFVSSSASVSTTIAAATCIAQNATVATPSAELLTALRSSVLPVGVSSLWTNENRGDVALTVDMMTLMSRNQWDGCWNASAGSNGTAAGCCLLVDVSGTASSFVVAGASCTSPAGVVCQRPGTPTSWLFPGPSFSEYEYGLFSRKASFDDAMATCKAFGGTLAALPTLPSPLLANLSTTLLINSSVALPFWVGFRTNATAGGNWSGSSGSVVYAYNATPIALIANVCAQVASFGTAAGGASWTASGVSCFQKLPFLCQRLAVQLSNAFQVPPFRGAGGTSSAPLVLEYMLSDGSIRGFTTSSAIMQCAAAGATVTKFSNASALINAFGDAAKLLTTVFGNGIWLDSSVAPIPSWFLSVSSSPCSYFNGTTVTSPAAFKTSCATKLPIVCEYALPVAPLAPLTATVQMNSVCSVRWSLQLATPTMRPLAYCSSAGCVTFAALSSGSSSSLSFGPFTGEVNTSLSFRCNESSVYCSSAAISITVMSSSATVGLLFRNQLISLGVVASPYSGVIGVPKTLDTLALPATAIQRLANITVRFEIAAASSVAASACSVSPSSAILSYVEPSVAPIVFCLGGDNTTVVQVVFTTTSNDPNSCTVLDFTQSSLASVAMKVVEIVRGARNPVESTYYLYGSSPTATFFFSTPPPAFAGPTFVCLYPTSVNDTSVPFATIGGVACLSSNASANSLTLSFNLGNSSASFILITLGIGGTARQMYNPSASVLSVVVTLQPIVVTLMSQIYDSFPGFVFTNTPFTIFATIPVTLPAGQTLFLNATFRNTDASFPTVLVLAFTGNRSNISSITPLNPNGDGTEDKALVPGQLYGLRGPYFQVNTTAWQFRILVPLPFSMLPQVPQYLYFGASPFPLALSPPSTAPLRTATVNFTLSCGMQCFGVVVSPSFLFFSSATATTQTFYLSPGNASTTVSLAWTMVSSTTQYVAPAGFSVFLRNSVSSTLSVYPSRTYYLDGVSYTIRVVASSPAPQSFALFRATDSDTILSVAPANITRAVVTDSFLFQLRGGSFADGAALTVGATISGPDFSAFAQPAAITLSPVLNRILVTISRMPEYILTASTATISISLSRAPMVASNLTVTIASSTGRISISPSVLTWLLGDNSTRQVTLIACTDCQDVGSLIFAATTPGSAVEVRSDMNICPLSSGACAIRSSAVAYVPIVSFGNISLLVTQPVLLRIGESTQSAIEVNPLPPFGTLNVSLSTSSQVAMIPPFVLFNSSSGSNRASVSLLGLAAAASEFNIMMLSGDGQVFYTRPPSLCFYIGRTLQIVPTPVNFLSSSSTSITLISTQNAAVFSLDFSNPATQECNTQSIPTSSLQLPTAGRYVSVLVTAVVDGYTSLAVRVLTPTVTWISNTSPQAQEISVVPTGVLSEPVVTIVGTVFGNASSYAGFSIVARVQPPTQVEVTFPVGKVYPAENATFGVNIGKPVALLSGSLTVTLGVQNNTCGAKLVVAGSGSITFVASSTSTAGVLTFHALTDLTTPCNATVLVTLSGPSLAEYAAPAKALAAVLFAPRRKIFTSVPQYTFDRTFFQFNVTLEEVPDGGTTVSFRSSAGLASPVEWTNTSNPTQALSVAPPYLLPGTNNVALTLVASSSMEQNRYELAPTLTFQTLTKLTVVRQGPPIRPYQVVGASCAQSVQFYLSRPPLNLSAVELSVTVSSVLSNLIAFTPSVFRWTSLDVDLSSRMRTLTIVGNALGAAKGVHLVFSSNFTDELGEPDSAGAVLPQSITILQRFTLSFSVNESTIYVGPANVQQLNVSLEVPADADISVAFNVTCSLASSTSDALSILPSPVFSFAPGIQNGSRWRVATLLGLSPGNGNLVLTTTSTPELSPVINGFAAIQVLPKISFDVFYEGTRLSEVATAASPLPLPSDTTQDFTLSMSSFAVAVSVRITVRATSSSGEDVMIICEPTEFSFHSSAVSSLSRDFNLTVFATSLTSINVTVEWYDTTRPQIFEQSYTLHMVILPDWRLQLNNFPSVLYEGERNGKTFSIDLLEGLSGSRANATNLNAVLGGSVAVAMSVACEGSTALSVTPTRSLSWSPGLFVSPTVVVNATYNTSSPENACSFSFSKNSSLIPLFLQHYPASNVSALYAFETVTIRVQQAPLQYASDASLSTVSIPCRDVQQQSHQFRIAVTRGVYQVDHLLQFPPVLTSVADPELDSLRRANPVVITTDASFDGEPLGLLHPDVLPTFPFNVTSNGTHAFLTVNPMPNLILINDARVFVYFNALAFVPEAYPTVSDSTLLNFTIGKYVANIIGNSQYQTLGIFSIVALPAAAFAAPSVTMQLFRQNLLLQIFACPRSDWSAMIYPLGTLQDPADSTLAQWMTVAVVLAAILGGVVLLHLGVVFIMQFVVGEARISPKTMQRFRGVANRFTIFSAIAHYPTAPCVALMTLAPTGIWYATTVLINSTNPGFRVASIILLLGYLVVFPTLMHGVVWRANSLVFVHYKKFHPLLGPCGFWWHPSNPTYLPRYWVLLLETRNNTRWYLLYQYAAACLVSIVMGVQPSTTVGCTAKSALVCTIAGVELISLCLLRPFRIALMNYLYIFTFAMQFAACVVITHVTTFAIRSDRLQYAALALFVVNAIGTLILALAGVFSRCFAKPIPKSAAVQEMLADERHRKKKLAFDDLALDAAADGGKGVLADRGEGDGDEGIDLAMDEDMDEPLHPGHPLFDTDNIDVAPPVGQFRSTSKGFLTGGESAFSPSRRAELRLREQFHRSELDARERILPLSEDAGLGGAAAVAAAQQEPPPVAAATRAGEDRALDYETVAARYGLGPTPQTLSVGRRNFTSSSNDLRWSSPGRGGTHAEFQSSENELEDVMQQASATQPEMQRKSSRLRVFEVQL